jgi:hypothetical protein
MARGIGLERVGRGRMLTSRLTPPAINSGPETRDETSRPLVNFRTRI